MYKRLLFFIIVISLLIGYTGCSINKGSIKDEVYNAKKGELFHVKNIDGFSSLSGFKVDGESFFFSGTKEGSWGYFKLDLSNMGLKKIYDTIGGYDVFIPLEGQDAIYVDLDGRLFVRKNGKDKKIDENIHGMYSPNILVSPDQKGILYIKGKEGEAGLYRYMLDEDVPIKIKDSISKEAFFTFTFTTHWSNKSHFFIFDNNEVYDSHGKLYAVINGTAAKWSPNDEMIAFIRKPQNLKDKQIFIGDWKSYIGSEFAIFNIDNRSDETIYKNDIGLIDAIDSIQWAKDSSLIAISVGKINKSKSGELESTDYEKIFVYNVESKMEAEVESMPYNFYEVLFHNYVYGSSIGKRDRIEIVQVFNKDRYKFEEPVILNNIDMFIISEDKAAYLISGNELIEFNIEGESRIIKKLPWEVSEMYFVPITNQLIIINKDLLLFVIKL